MKFLCILKKRNEKEKCINNYRLLKGKCGVVSLNCPGCMNIAIQ